MFDRYSISKSEPVYLVNSWHVEIRNNQIDHFGAPLIESDKWFTGSQSKLVPPPFRGQCDLQVLVGISLIAGLAPRPAAGMG